MTEEITRIELQQYPTYVSVAKYDPHWRPGYPAKSRTINKEKSFDEMVAWLKEHGWDVIEFKDLRAGHRRARAWLGPRYPIRCRADILRLRQEMANGRRPFLGQDVDLAYWY